MNFPHYMTLYHRNGDTWTRTVIRGVLWEDLAGIILRRAGTAAEDKAQVYIPMPNIEVAEKDIIVKGVCIKEIVKSSKEIPEGLYVTTVETLDYGNLKHWRVTAR